MPISQPSVPTRHPRRKTVMAVHAPVRQLSNKPNRPRSSSLTPRSGRTDSTVKFKSTDYGNEQFFWTVLDKCLNTHLNQQACQNNKKIKSLMDTVEHQRHELGRLQLAKTRWEQFYRDLIKSEAELNGWRNLASIMCSPDEIRSAIPKSNFRSPTLSCEFDSQNSQSLDSTNLVQRLERLVRHDIEPAFNRLVLRNFEPGSSAGFESCLDKASQTASLFNSLSEKELETLESLADEVDRIVYKLETHIIPQTRTKMDDLVQTVNLFAYEASLVFAQIQRQWLSAYAQLSPRLDH